MQLTDTAKLIIENAIEPLVRNINSIERWGGEREKAFDAFLNKFALGSWIILTYVFYREFVGDGPLIRFVGSVITGGVATAILFVAIQGVRALLYTKLWIWFDIDLCPVRKAYRDFWTRCDHEASKLMGDVPSDQFHSCCEYFTLRTQQCRVSDAENAASIFAHFKYHFEHKSRDVNR